MRYIVPKDSRASTSAATDDDEKNTVKDTRKMWESRASTGSIGTKLKKATFGTAKTVVGGTIGATKTVAKGTLGAGKAVVGGTVGATKTVAKGTIGATKTVAKGTFGAGKAVVGGTVGATKTVGKVTYGGAKTAGKSARQAFEDVALFASPRVVQKKLNIGKRTKVFETIGDEEKKEERRAPIAIPKAAGFEAAKERENKKADTPAERPKPKAPGPKHMTISERARAYEAATAERAKKFDIVTGAPGAPPMRMHGKRTSRLDKFSPVVGRRMHQGKADPAFLKAPFAQQQAPQKAKSDTDEPSPVLEEEKPKSETDETAPVTEKETEKSEADKKSAEKEALSPTTVGSCVTDDGAAPEAPTLTTTAEEGAEPVTPEPEVPAEPMKEEVEVPVASDKVSKRQSMKKSIKGSSKIDRDTIILQEIVEIIREAEETEIYQEIDEETIEILKESAIKSAAYSKRWYDAVTDSFIHCPSLAQTIVDYTLLEIAEEKFQELYEEEFPMLYTVGLRGVACNLVAEEEEVPDYVYDFAM